jgi:chromosome segregation ATPase
MAPKTAKASKRVADGSRGKAAKVAKVDPAMQAVIDVIDGAEDLPLGCKQMLLAMLPGSLCVTKDARTAAQDRVVEMIGELVDTQKSSLQAAADAEDSKFAEIEASKIELEQIVVKAEGVLQETTEVLVSKQTAAQEAKQTSKNAAASLKEATTAEASAEEAVTKIEAERKQLQDALDTHLSSLCAEDFEPESALGHRDAVMESITNSTEAFESALLLTLPEALMKLPAQRGDFDKMAIDTLKKNLGGHLERLGANLENARAAKDERAAVVKAATEQMNAAQDLELAGATALCEAEEKNKGAATALQAAKDARQQYEPTLASATAERDGKQSALKSFEEHNAFSFKTLQMATAATMEDAHKLGA